MAHMDIPIGNTKNPIEVTPMSIMIPMMVRTLFLAVMAFYCLVLNVYGLYMAVKVQNYCLESDFYPFFIYLHYLKSG